MDRLSSLVGILVSGMVVVLLGVHWIAELRQADQMFRCSNRLRALAIGVHNYHSTYGVLPMAVGGTTGGKGFDYVDGVTSKQSNAGRLSGFASLLPFIDQLHVWEKLWASETHDGFPRMGPTPSYDPGEYPLWAVQIDSFLCPADRARKGTFGMRSYVMCYGDSVDRVGRLFDSTDNGLRKAVGRGPFVPHHALRFQDIHDGQGNTILLSETRIGNGSVDVRGRVARGVEGLIEKPAVALSLFGIASDGYQSGQETWAIGKGSRWPEGCFLLNAFNTVLPPNSPSATLVGDPESGCMSASSHHPGGVHVAMCNGSIRFVLDSIDTGQLSNPSVSPKNSNVGAESPYGVWGALGTRAGLEIIPSEREAAFSNIR